jgi:hypothetical protein
VHVVLVGGVASLWGGGSGDQGEASAEVEREMHVQLTTEPLSESRRPPLDAAKEPLPPAGVSHRPENNSAWQNLEPTADSRQPIADRREPTAVPAKELDDALTLPRVEIPTVPGAVEVNFFGTRAKGAKFVYVIDRSASMKQALALAKHELLQSLQLLPRTAEYQVVYYDLQPRILELDGKTGMLPATLENKLSTSRHLENVRSEGGTDHVRALRRGLTLSPQVLYFLTDADELKPQQVHELTALNQRGSNARIHCIELSAEAAARGDSAMRMLARDNRGEYRAVDPATWRRAD